MISTGTDDLLRLARERADFLEAEVRRLRAERAVMLDVIEAAEAADMTCHCIGSGGTNQLPKLTYECASHRFGKALTRFRDLTGDNRE